MPNQVKWRDLVYCSKDKFILTPEGQLNLSTAYQENPILFIVDLLKSAVEAQTRNNSLVPVDQYATSFTEVVNPQSYLDTETQETMDILQLSIQVATKDNQQVIKGI